MLACCAPRPTRSRASRQIYYHLEEYTDAVRWALAAGLHFEVTAKTEYVDVIVCE